MNGFIEQVQLCVAGQCAGERSVVPRNRSVPFPLSMVLKRALYISEIPNSPSLYLLSYPLPVSLACPGMEAHYFESRLICLVENSLPRGCIEDLVRQSICGISPVFCPRLRLDAKVSAHAPNSQTGLSRTIWLPLTLMLMLHDSVTVRILSGVM